MGFVFQQFIDEAPIYACLSCQAHITRKDSVISRTFQGRLGRAYLTESVVNEKLGKNEDRLLMTGLHTVRDLYCRCCNTLIGWKYVRAFDKAQRYKEGRYVLEQSQIYDVGYSTDSSIAVASSLPTRQTLMEASPPSLDQVLSRFMRDVGIQTG
ncbi:hypothetical protein IWW36_005497 [Coemansia brasiliensis]|uniref:Protein yippee-like n=1 Tax=Coemansia brasiliensis TaxID=2650707 RepID=A0A9W8IA37_9FUNG|nr:hypothetical protein IWW36_005497 [Coemansia brasiliensis]